MEARGKDCEEETLQTAFKKLRVDAESLSCTVNVCEPSATRPVARPCTEVSGAKPKLCCPKDNWHGCMRKTSRGASRSQRRRRSKSPILQLPKFTYCSSAAVALSPSSGRLKQQRLANPEAAEPCPSGDGGTPSAMPPPTPKDPCPSSGTCHISPPVFGACASYKADLSASRSPQEIPTQAPPAAAAASGLESRGPRAECSSSERGACEGIQRGPSAADFQSLSKLHSSSGSAAGACPPCSCSPTESAAPASGRRCSSSCRSLQPGWQGVEVYSFTGIRHAISQCESNPADAHSPSRTGSSTGSNATSPATASTAGSPRSCSEQARAYVDDITIEDLSGYMEYYLYIPKKMSHMAEMMYT